MMIIYKIENNINGKIYIGLTTKDLSKRIAEHVAENKSYVQKALNKYGLQSFAMSIIDSAESREILCEKEQYWIRYYDCKAPNGYNLTDGGDGLINPSEVVRKKIANTLKKGHYVSDGFTGHKHSEKSRKQNGEKQKAIWQNPEYRKQQVESRKGKTAWNKGLTKETNANVAKIGRKGRKVWNEGQSMKELNPDYVNPMQGEKRPDLSERNRLGQGRKDSEETRLRKSLASKGRPKSKEHVLHIAQAKSARRNLNKKRG
jgi:group I intron endonuclease